MAILVPKKKEFWLRRPIGFQEVNWNNGFASDLALVFIFNEGSGLPNDIVAGQTLSVFAPYSWEEDYFKLGNTGTGSLPQSLVAIGRTFNSIDTWTIAGRAAHGTLAPGGFPSFVEMVDPANSFNARVSIGRSPASYLKILSSGNTPGDDGSLVADGVAIDYALTHGGGGNLSCYKNSNFRYSVTHPDTSELNGLNELRFATTSDDLTNNSVQKNWYTYLFTRALSGEEVAVLHEAPYQILKPRKKSHFFLGASGGGADPITVATETDSASDLSGHKISTISTAVETDVGVDLSSIVVTAITVAAETDIATDITGYKQSVISTATEVDTAVDLSSLSVTPITVASEIDSASDLVGFKRSGISVATQTDIASDLTGFKTNFIATANETDTASDLSGFKLDSVSIATETDTASDLSGFKLDSVSIATETDTALNLTLIGGALPIDTAIQADTASDLTGFKVSAIDVAAETDTASDLTGFKLSNISVATQTDIASDLTGFKVSAIDVAAETDTASDLTGFKVSAIDVAAETDTALNLTLIGGVLAIDTAIEIDIAYNLSSPGGVLFKGQGLMAVSHYTSGEMNVL